MVTSVTGRNSHVSEKHCSDGSVRSAQDPFQELIVCGSRNSSVGPDSLELPNGRAAVFHGLAAILASIAYDPILTVIV